MSKRKTIHMSALIDSANAYLAYGFERKDTSITPDMRKGACALLEAILLAGDVYAGYTYLEPCRDGIDTTRRHYYKHPDIR